MFLGFIKKVIFHLKCCFGKFSFTSTVLDLILINTSTSACKKALPTLCGPIPTLNKYEVLIAGAQVNFLIFFSSLFTCFALFVFSLFHPLLFWFFLCFFVCFLLFLFFCINSWCLVSIFVPFKSFLQFFSFLHFWSFSFLLYIIVLIAGVQVVFYFCCSVLFRYFHF